jgi:23S rRNA (guanosine2251-2'-O)-methyltransferase
MPGNSPRRGARRTSSKKGPTIGSGGKNRQSLAGRGRTLPADERPWHKAYSGDEPLPERTAWKQDKERRAAAVEGRAPKVGTPGSKNTSGRGGKKAANPPPKGGPRVAPGRRSTPPKDAPELLVGRLPVVEALRASVPATALYAATGIEIDERVAEAIRTASSRGIPLLEVSRAELDRMTGGVLHQGIGLQVPPFAYELFEDLLAAAEEHVAPLLIALDGITEPRNLGMVVRSAAAFGAHGIFVPERRSANMIASAWRTSAGAATRVPMAKVGNLVRAIKMCQDRGFVVVGLDADGEASLHDLEAAVGPLVVVVGSEGRGLTRLVGQTCDMRVRIPMASEIESLNAPVAAAVALAEVARRRSST